MYGWYIRSVYRFHYRLFFTFYPKSLLGVLSMGITKGTRVSIIAEGPDEEEAVKALTDMLVKEVF